MCLRSIRIGTLLYHFLKGVVLHFALIYLPYIALYHFLGRTPSSIKCATFFLNGASVFCILMLFDFLSFEVSTLREENFAGIDFCKFFFQILRGNKFLAFGLYQGFLGIDFRSNDL